jgi:SAM-dependent methyltransferase
MTDHEAAEARVEPGAKKANFNDTYDRPTPKAYYYTLRDLDYRLPELARPYIKRSLRTLRWIHRRDRVMMIDLCCGYGVNAALLNHDIDMQDLYDRCADGPDERLPVSMIVEQDRRLFAGRRQCPIEAEVIGVDVAANALDYARNVGLLAEGLPLDLEREDPDAATRALLGDADIVTVTGGLSYIGKASFERLFDCFPADRRPWVIGFPLRHVNVDDVVDTLARFGLSTDFVTTLPQRRMSDARERQLVLQQLREAGLDPKDERAGYLHAVCAISRPAH